MISPLPIRIVSDLVRHLPGKLHNGNIAFRRVFRNAFNEAVDGGFQRIDLFLVRPCKRIIHRAGNIQHEGNVERLRFFLRGRFTGRPCFHGDGIGPISIGSGILGKLHSGVCRQGADGQQTERHHARHQHCHQSPFHFIHSLRLNLSISPKGGPCDEIRSVDIMMTHAHLFVNIFTVYLLLRITFTPGIFNVFLCIMTGFFVIMCLCPSLRRFFRPFPSVVRGRFGPIFS